MNRTTLEEMGPLPDGGRVVIIGGGPGGVGCALALQRMAGEAGRQVQITVLEGKQFRGERHHNLCAGVLSPPLPDLLQDRLGVAFPSHLGLGRVQGLGKERAEGRGYRDAHERDRQQRPRVEEGNRRHEEHGGRHEREGPERPEQHVGPGRHRRAGQHALDRRVQQITFEEVDRERANDQREPEDRDGVADRMSVTGGWGQNGTVLLSRTLVHTGDDK